MVSEAFHATACCIAVSQHPQSPAGGAISHESIYSCLYQPPGGATTAPVHTPGLSWRLVDCTAEECVQRIEEEWAGREGTQGRLADSSGKVKCSV